MKLAVCPYHSPALMKELNMLTVMGREAMQRPIYGHVSQERMCDRMHVIEANEASFFGKHVQMEERGLISFDDLALNKDRYEILGDIDSSAPELYETPWDDRPGYICLNEFIFKVGIRIPFEFGSAFGVALTFVGKGSVELINNLPDSMPERKSSWGVLDWWEKRLPNPIFALETFFYWCEILTHLATSTVLVPSLLGAEREKKKKKHLRKRPYVISHIGRLTLEPKVRGKTTRGKTVRTVMVQSGQYLISVTIDDPQQSRNGGVSNEDAGTQGGWIVISHIIQVEEELVRGKGANFRTTLALSLEVALVAVFEVLVEPNHSRATGSALASPSEGISTTIEESHSMRPISTDFSLRLRGAPQVIDFEEEGGPTPNPTFIGEPSLSKRDEHVLRPGPLPYVWECLATTLLIALSKARTEGERCFLHELQEIGRRVSRVVALEAEAVNAIEECLKEEEADLLSDLVAALVERDEAVNDATTFKVEALGLLAELITFRSEVEALHARGVEPDADGAEP
ncbi:hypothetical protein ACLOJK_007437 [Asimina triloba]